MDGATIQTLITQITSGNIDENLNAAKIINITVDSKKIQPVGKVKVRIPLTNAMKTLDKLQEIPRTLHLCLYLEFLPLQQLPWFCRKSY